MVRTLLATATLFAVGIAAPLAYSSKGDHGSPQTGHIGICHHTGNSQAHTFIYIEPDASGVFDGHGKLSHQYDDDIIPAFTYTNAHGQVIAFAGLNLTTVYGGFTGAQLLANRCQAPGSTTGKTTTTIKGSTTTVKGSTTTTIGSVTVPPRTVTIATTVAVTGPTVTIRQPGKTVTVIKKVPATNAPAKVMKGLTTHQPPIHLTG